VLPGLWRLRLPLIWKEIRSANAWAIDDGQGGCVLVDCGMAGPAPCGWHLLRAALAAAGFAPADVSLLVVTHCHADHYGLAGPVVEAAGCELWMHPAHGHLTDEKRNLADLVRRRRARALRAGAPPAVVEHCADVTEEREGVAWVIEPDRLLTDGVEVGTGLGVWQVVETPGHAPSHVCLFEPRRRLLLSGDHVLPVWAPYFELGYSLDPVSEYLRSLTRVERLEPELLLPGHGRSSRNAGGRIRAARTGTLRDVEAIRDALEREPSDAWTLLLQVLDTSSDLDRSWAVPTVLAYLLYLERRGEVERDEEGEVTVWRVAS